MFPVLLRCTIHPFPTCNSQFHYLVVVRATTQANYRVFAAGTTHLFRSGEVVVPAVNKMTPGSWTLACRQYVPRKNIIPSTLYGFRIHYFNFIWIILGDYNVTKTLLPLNTSALLESGNSTIMLLDNQTQSGSITYTLLAPKSVIHQSSDIIQLLRQFLPLNWAIVYYHCTTPRPGPLRPFFSN